MSGNNIFENAFSNIDDELIAEAKSPAIRIAARRKKIVIRSVAACIAAVLIAIPSIKVMKDSKNNGFSTTPHETEVIYEEEIIYKEEVIKRPEGSKQSQVQSEETKSEQMPSGETTSKPTQSTESKKEQTSAPKKSATKGESSKKPTSKPSTDSSQNGIDYSGLTDDITIYPSDLYFTNLSQNGTTVIYENVYVPNVEYLYINSIPTDKYVKIYNGYYQKEIDQNEAQSLADKYFPKIINALHIPTPQYETEIDDDKNPSITIGPKTESYYYTKYYGIDFSITNMQNRNIFRVASRENPLTINEKTFSINRNQSDTDIINSISDIKQELFNIFDVSFDSAKVIHHFNDYYFDAGYVWVLLYDSNAHTLNNRYGDFPYTDYILIQFDDYNDKSTDIYYASDIEYWSFRTENNSYSKAICQKELLPLEKAEEYLRKGYVLASGCTQCKSEQTPVDFTGYDYVSLDYEGGINIKDLTLPYYTFYKNIGTAENGNMIFAKTYVPAVEVKGYEEYFINKHDNHKKSN